MASSSESHQSTSYLTDVSVERSTHDWIIFDCDNVFKNVEKSKKVTRRAVRRLGATTNERQDLAEVELISNEFIYGQTVNRTSTWQMELKIKSGYLCGALVCINCFHEEVNEIWVRFDTDIVDFDGVVLYSAGSASFFHDANLTNFTPRARIRNRGESFRDAHNSYWEADILPICDLVKNWKAFVPRNILNLRLRLYIYREKPFNQARYIAEHREPVKLCYTDNFRLLSNPLLRAIRTLWDSKEDADVQFKIGEELLTAHKFIVSVQSPALKRMISQKIESDPEKKDCIVEVSGCSFHTFQELLKFLYTQDAEEVKTRTDMNYLAEMLGAAKMFEVGTLARICLVRLLINMTAENFARTASAIYANVPEEKSFFRAEVKKFLMESQPALQANEDFKLLATTDNKLFLEICFEPMELIYPNFLSGHPCGPVENHASS